MTDPSLPELAARIRAMSHRGTRRLVALVGPPASGKSTLAAQLADTLGPAARVVPMDGFHLDNTILEARGLLPRKGAPETFDAAGFRHLCARLASEPEVIYPTFDRGRDIAIAGSGRLGPDCDTVVVEGNYLLLDDPAWRDLHPLWDVSIWLDVDLAEIERRLMERWRIHGLDEATARARTGENDLPNARLIRDRSVPATLTLRR
ncbi:MAG: nucleoside/nucleotide kinase family protein [Pseudomonadota bacterium]